MPASTPVTADGGEEALRILRADPGFACHHPRSGDARPRRHGRDGSDGRDGITTPVIVQTAHSSLETSSPRCASGAIDFFVKPVPPERLIVSLRNALKLDELETIVRTERNRRTGTLGLADIVTRSPAMHRVLTLRQKAAKSAIPVLIEGETGTGKELIARVIQGTGRPRRQAVRHRQLRAIPNLSNQPSSATRRAPSPAPLPTIRQVRRAPGGTLFLDEVGELPPPRRNCSAPSDGEIEPVGAQARARQCPGHLGHQPAPARPRPDRRRSARISTTGSTSSRSMCRRCANAPRTSASRRHFVARFAAESRQARRRHLRAARSICSRPT